MLALHLVLAWMESLEKCGPLVRMVLLMEPLEVVPVSLRGGRKRVLGEK